ncbi:glycerate kinase [Treponema sp. HNW]|uniref:glycerate kinase family protein n=1 Tax=Treponema sp. HNW TaxID=3116654 RepID=UPI003D0A53EE
MKKILLIPDSFKGTMSSARICALMKEAVEDIFPGCETTAIPVADGGEGSVDAFLEAVGGEKIRITVKNPFFEDMEGFYGILNSKTAGAEKTAVVEMAACAGLPLVLGRLNPRITTTYGAGQLIADAVQKGCKNIIIGLGGSATNDAGCGAAAALGVEFFDKDGKSFVPAGGTLKNIERIDISKALKLLKGCTLTAMCDIDNPLYGTNGAAYIFGPQKGADETAVQELDAGLRHLSDIVKKDLGIDKADFPGAGAAGGMGYGMLSFLGAELKMGIETVLDTTDFDRKLKGADFVFTGEGKIDSQSLRGKVVIGVARRAKKAGVPVIAVVGDAEAGLDAAYDTGVTAVFSINRLAVPFSEAKKTAEADLSAAMRDILRLIRAAV